MKFEVNVEKRFAVFIVVGLLVLGGAILTLAYTASPGAVPNPGHPLNSIQGYFSGDSDLQASLGKLCQTDGTNCPAVLSTIGYDTGWFKMTQLGGNWNQEGALQIKYAGSTRTDYSCYQVFQIRDVYPQNIADARLMINITNNDFNKGHRSLGCIPVNDQRITEADNRPYLYCEEILDEGVGSLGYPYNCGTLNVNNVDARIYVQALTN